jgi:glycosyltransferase involved in cell wall biosynthesis
MKLGLFPTIPGKKSGHEIAVQYDIQRIGFSENDKILVLSNDKPKEQLHLPKRKKTSFKYLLNILNKKPGDIVTESELRSFLRENKIDIDSVTYVFCGEVIFYDALKTVFPDKRIDVRFHNLYARVKAKTEIVNLKVESLKYRVIMSCFSNLENKIFGDTQVGKIFISEEEGNFYQNLTHGDDYQVWNPIFEKISIPEKVSVTKRPSNFVWYGTLSTHKVFGMKQFIDKVFSKLKKEFPHLELHMYGKGSESFGNTGEGIHGHGFFVGDRLPIKEDSIFINPDILGGGVKIKLLDLLNNGVNLISTPEGFEGVPKTDASHIHVVRFEDWASYLRKKLLESN